MLGGGGTPPKTQYLWCNVTSSLFSRRGCARDGPWRVSGEGPSLSSTLPAFVASPRSRTLDLPVPFSLHQKVWMSGSISVLISDESRPETVLTNRPEAGRIFWEIMLVTCHYGAFGGESDGEAARKGLERIFLWRVNGYAWHCTSVCMMSGLAVSVVRGSSTFSLLCESDNMSWPWRRQARACLLSLPIDRYLSSIFVNGYKRLLRMSRAMTFPMCLFRSVSSAHAYTFIPGQACRQVDRPTHTPYHPCNAVQNRLCSHLPETATACCCRSLQNCGFYCTLLQGIHY